MNRPNQTREGSITDSPRGSGEKISAIILIVLSIVSLAATPRGFFWTIICEGLVGFLGIILFIHARIRFWRTISK